MHYKTIEKIKDKGFWVVFILGGLLTDKKCWEIQNERAVAEATSHEFFAILLFFASIGLYYFITNNWYYNQMHKQKAEGY